MQGMILNRAEKQMIRAEIIEDLQEIKKKAYSGVTCREYEALHTALYLMQIIYKQEQEKINEKQG